MSQNVSYYNIEKKNRNNEKNIHFHTSAWNKCVYVSHFSVTASR